MYILQYMDDGANFWKSLYFAKGKEEDLLAKYEEFLDLGFVVRVFTRVNVNSIKILAGGIKNA